MIYVFAFLIGLSAGLRAMTAPAAVSWAARLGWLNLSWSALDFLGAAVTPWIFTAAALAELVNDKLPKTGSRKALPAFAARIVMGALCGVALGASGHGTLLTGLGTGAVGVVGAVMGTLGGYEFRTRLTRAAGGRGLPVALLEDAIAIALAVISVRCTGLVG